MSSSSSTTNTNLSLAQPSTSSKPLNQKQPKRKKVAKACLFCKRSHMTCDDARPCQRCIKRDISHLCRDEPPGTSTSRPSAARPTSSIRNIIAGGAPATKRRAPAPGSPLTQRPDIDPMITEPPLGLLEPLAHATAAALPGLSPLFGARPLPSPPALLGARHREGLDECLSKTLVPTPTALQLFDDQVSGSDRAGADELDLSEFLNAYPGLFSDGPTDAAGLAPTLASHMLGGPAAHSPPPGQGGREDRLAQIIREAGVERFDYGASQRAMRAWVEETMSEPAKERMLVLLRESSELFASVAQTAATEVESEYQFKRSLIDHRAVLDTLPVPGCIWRRTGEICRTNGPLSELLGQRRSRGRRTNVCELWDENSNLNYWEKFNRIALDESQKGVLTSCVLLIRRDPTPSTEVKAENSSNGQIIPQPGSVTRLDCTFSFTVRRDSFGLPCLIIGNFLPS